MRRRSTPPSPRCEHVALCRTASFIRVQYKENKGKFDEFEASVATLKAEWLEPLSQLVGQINELYGQFFARLDCAGEVALVTPEKEVRAGVLLFLRLLFSEC